MLTCAAAITAMRRLLRCCLAHSRTSLVTISRSSYGTVEEKGREIGGR